MTPQNELDLHGTFSARTLAGLFAEIAHAKLTGSLRISAAEKKTVTYFDAGSVIFAVSNSRRFRLQELLVGNGRIDRSALTAGTLPASDLEFVEMARRGGLLTAGEIDQIFVDQIRSIIADTLSWESGDWTFSPLTRLRSGISYQIDLPRILIDHGRGLAAKDVEPLFRARTETFEPNTDREPPDDLQPHEAFVLSRFTGSPLTIAEAISISSLPEAAAVQTLYVLWLGGSLIRRNWNPVFSDIKIAALKAADVKLKQPASRRLPTDPKPEPEPALPQPSEPEPEISITVEEYLSRLERAETHYDTLGLSPDAELPAIRRSYFSLAKQFHPDRYHQEDAARLRRIEHAFTELAHAYETLKKADSRSAYDFKMRKELADKEKRRESPTAGEKDDSALAERAAADFAQGSALLERGDAESAAPMLARAVHFAPANAEYHAYYGQALSLLDAQHHKAEAEFHTAVKLDPGQPLYRMMLAEFFVRMNLMKRAEGELNRLLAAFPGHREAAALLDRLATKS